MYKIRNNGGLVGMKGASFAPGLTELSKADFDKLDQDAFKWWVDQGRLEIIEEPRPEPKTPAPKKKAPKKKTTKKKAPAE
jgi:hypothetical protein